MKSKIPKIAVGWLIFWGTFQVYVLSSIFSGSWEKPLDFPEAAYYALVYPDLVFIPLYFLAAILLVKIKPLGVFLGIFTLGAVSYVMVYLLALSRLHGVLNVTADSLFLLMSLVSIWDLVQSTNTSR
jgi:hypothetical protein